MVLDLSSSCACCILAHIYIENIVEGAKRLKYYYVFLFVPI